MDWRERWVVPLIVFFLLTLKFAQEFDNKNVTFEEHIRNEHNMWHYLYFIVLIKVKDPTEFTGPESYVHQMVKVNFSFSVCIPPCRMLCSTGNALLKIPL